MKEMTVRKTFPQTLNLTALKFQFLTFSRVSTGLFREFSCCDRLSESCCNASGMQERPLTKRLDYVFGKMQRYHTQSDDGTEDEPVSSTTNEPGSDDDNYDREDDLTEDQGRLPYSHDPTGTGVDLKLATLLNGPQWQKPNPYTRRAARVDYSLKKKPSQSAQKRPPRKPKVCAQTLVPETSAHFRHGRFRVHWSRDPSKLQCSHRCTNSRSTLQRTTIELRPPYLTLIL